MKLFALSALILFTSLPAMAATIQGGRLKGNKIELDVTYGGGCEKHVFKVKLGMCLESNPPRCEAELLDVTPRFDACEALVSQKVVFTLQELSLTDFFSSGASLVIKGDNDSQVLLKLRR